LRVNCQQLTDLNQFERDRRWPAFRLALARLAYTSLPRVVMAGLELGAAGLEGPQIPKLFSRDVRELPSTLNDDLLDLFGGSPRLLVSNLLETGTITLRDLKVLQSAGPAGKSGRNRGGKRHA